MTIVNPDDLAAALDRDRVVLTVPAITEGVRDVVRRRRPLVLIETPSVDMGALVDALRPHVEALIDRLVRAPDLMIGDDLQQVLDLGLYNPRLGTLFETLWLARFEYGEGRDFTPATTDLVRTTFDEQPLIRNDSLLFWLTLLRQNAPTLGDVIVMIGPVDGRDLALDTQSFCRSAEHWESLGSPVRIVTDARAS